MHKGVCQSFLVYLKTRFRPDEHIIFAHWNDAIKQKNGLRNEYSYLANLDKDLSEMYRLNQDDCRAIAFAFNSYKSNESRKEDNVARILHAVIDMDGNPSIDDFNKMISWLDSEGVTPALMSESRNGYHILIPVDMQVTEKHFVCQFLDNAQKIYPRVDLSLKPLSSLIRIPESFHYKSRIDDPSAPGFQLKLFPDSLPTPVQIEKNTAYMRSLAIDEKPVIETEVVPSNDIFFRTLLKSSELITKISKLPNIQKNGVLFKNLALFVKQYPVFLPDAQKLVIKSGHPEETLKQWSENKNITQVNYLELLKWINNNKIDFLLSLMHQQLTQGDILHNFNFFFMVNSQSGANYKVMNEHGHIFDNPVTFNHLVKSLYYLVLSDGMCLFDYYKIIPFDDKGRPKTIDAKLKILATIMLTRINERTIPLHGERFYPTDELVFEINNKVYLNTYVKADVRRKELIKTKCEFPNINRILRHITVDEVNYAWLLKWLAFIVQNPTIKLPTSLVLKGGQGSGKGIFYKFIIKYLFGDENINQISTDTFKRGWGDTFRNKLFVNFDEFTLVRGKDDEHIERLKTITSESSVTLSLKGQDSQKTENFCHFLFTSNKSNPIPLQKDDRRYTIFDQRKAIPLTYVDAIDPALHEDTHAKEIHHLYSYLMRLPVEHRDVIKAMDNETKKDNIENNLNSVEAMLLEIKNYDDFFAFYDDYNQINSAASLKNYEHDGIFEHKSSMHITSDKLHDIYVSFCHKSGVKNPMMKSNLGRELSLNEIKGERITRFNKKLTCYKLSELEGKENE